MHFLGLFLLFSIILPLLFVLAGQKQVDIFFLFFTLFCRSAVQRSGLQCTLNFHIVGLGKRSCDVDVLAFLETVLFLF